jgi:hypothetical protein
MFEITLKIESPDIVNAINALTAKIGNSGVSPTPAPAIQEPAQPMQPAQQIPQPTQFQPTPPVSVPVAPATQIAPQIPTMPVQPSVMPVAPQMQPQVPTAPMSQMPTSAPTFNLDQIARAGASLVDTGKQAELLAVLARFGIQAVTQLPKEAYGTFASELRALGAQI